MAEEDIRRCMQWICEQQQELESSPMGICHAEVQNMLASQKVRNQEIDSQKSQINKLIKKHQLPDMKARQLTAAYESVKDVSSKRSSCMETLSGISNLEAPIEEMCSEFEAKAIHLVNMAENNKRHADKNSQTNESLARASRNCVAAVRQNWQWINTVFQCAQVHLLNAAAYHQFFHEVEEAEYWMNKTMSRLHLTFDRSKLKGDRADASVVQDEIKDVLLAYLQWQTKVESLFDRAKNIVPIPQRMHKLDNPRPVLALTDYKTSEIEFREGDTLTLLDNSDRKKWLVTNAQDQKALVPAVILLVPAPSGIAVDAANKLRIQLLTLWTVSTKRLGYQMIAFMGFVFRDWTEQEIKGLQAMPQKDKDALVRTIGNIEQALGKTWNGYGDFQKLKSRMAKLKDILEEDVKPAYLYEGSEVAPTAVVQIKSLDALLNRYQDFWTYWETFKVVVELSRQPKLLLVCDKWEELRYISTAHFVKFWDTAVDLEIDDLSKDCTILSIHETPKESLPPAKLYKIEKPVVEEKITQDETVIEEATITKTTSSEAQSQPEEDEDTEEEVDYYEEQEETVTESVESSVLEERQTFAITGVKDPRTNKSMSLQEGIMLGLIDPATREFVHPVTKQRLELNAAMSEGFLIVEMQSRETTKVENKSYGIITIKTTKDTRPYSITAVVDPETEEELTVNQATKKGIIDLDKGIYKTETGEELSIRDAISSGLVMVDFTEGGEENGHQEEITRTYAVYGVVNQNRKCKIPFREACDLGLLEKETGQYYNNATFKRLPISEAIMKGFIKARLVTDPSKLDVDPSDNIVVDRLKSARDKILGAVRTTRAFKEVASK